MKKLLVLAASAGLVFSGAAAVTANVLNTPVVETKAEAASSALMIEDEVDVAGKTTWSSEEGTFLEINNWYNSGLGISMEVQIDLPETGAANGMAFDFYSGSTKLTSTTYYLFDRKVSGNITWSNMNHATALGNVEFIDKTTGWIRVDMMFNKITNPSSTTLPLNKIVFKWYGTIAKKIRNMKLISNQYSSIGDHIVNYNETYNAGLLQNKSGMDVREMPIFDRWHSCGKGVSFEFQPTLQKDSCIYLCDADWFALSSGNPYYYQPANASRPQATCNVGQLTDLGDGWYRYELMFADMEPITGRGELSAYVLKLYNNWGANYNCEPNYRRFKAIDAYSTAVEVDVGSYATGVMNKTAAVCVADGSTDLTALEGAVSELKTSYNSLIPQGKIYTIYPDQMVGTDAKSLAKQANARLGYIFAKYPSISNYTPLPLTAAYGASFLFNGNSASEYYVVAAVGGVALFAAGGLIFSRKKKHN